MVYIIRRKNNDKYYSFIQNTWENELTEKCWMNKEQISLFKEKHKDSLDNYLIYTILNPSNIK